ncbi:ABC transporter permease [Paracoccus versutus]|uniref:D-xylose transport system permease protein n=2 Tax=Paracoccus versutus TaxID=34007 RepID=A0A3D9XS71_PARVE|nr:ABC transporter permease [Paracoccus versutus]REF73294.1 D-xylose transport system permease protein [Paracoccus versutus]
MTAEKRVDWMQTFGLREMGVFYALLILVVVLSITTAMLGRANYLSVLNVMNVLYQSSLIGFMAVAMTVILISGNFDLSVASVAALSAAVFVGSANAMGLGGAFVMAMGTAIIAGVVNGSIVQFLGINAFIVTLGSLTAIRGLVLIYTDGASLTIKDPAVEQALRVFESNRVDVGIALTVLAVLLLVLGIVKLVRAGGLRPSSLGLLLSGAAIMAFAFAAGFEVMVKKPVIYLALFTTAVWFVLRFTSVGRRIYAVGGNPEAARLSGINVTQYKLMAFVFCSATAGFAGILFAARLRSMNPTGLQGAELTVIAAAILGGTSLFGGAGSVVKTVGGALVLYSLTNGFNILNLGANYQGLIEGVVVVAAAAIYTVGGRGAGKGK